MKFWNVSLLSMMRCTPSARGGWGQEADMEQHEMFLDSVRHVAKLCAVAAMTAPKSGGQLFLKGGTPFIETVIVEDKATLQQLAEWLRAQGNKHKGAIWFRDADIAEKLDLVFFIGLVGWYP